MKKDFGLRYSSCSSELSPGAGFNHLGIQRRLVGRCQNGRTFNRAESRKLTLIVLPVAENCNDRPLATVHRTILLADAKGREALSMLERFLKGSQPPTSLAFRSKRGTALRETSVLPRFLHPALRTLGFPQAGMHAFRHGCNRRWELCRMNSTVLRQQMGHSSAVMTTRYTGGNPLYKVQQAFSKMNWKILELLETAALYRQPLSCV